MLPVRELPFGGKIVSDLEAVPPAVQVGGRHLGETFEEVVILRSLSGRMLAAVRAEAEGDGVSVEAMENSGQYRIRQKVCGRGSRTNQVCFRAETAGRPAAVSIPVSYTGVENE